MSNKEIVLSCTAGYVSGINLPNVLSGHLYQVIEAIGLPETQEIAVKKIIKEKIWSIMGDSLIISPERHTNLRDLGHKERKEAMSEGRPIKSI